MKSRKKITLVGAGKVGSTALQLCAYKELGDLVLVNRTAETAKGLALDLSESGPIEGFDVSVTGTGDYKDSKDSDVVVIASGAQRKEGMSRDDLLYKNAEIVGAAAKELARQSPDAVMIVVSNPLDAMVHVAHKASKFKPSKVVGMAGILDTSRFRSFIASELDVSVEDVSAVVLGGHGDFMVPLPEHASVNGVPITQLLPGEKIAKIVERTRNAGAEIISLMKDSSAYYAPGAAVAEMIEAVVKDKKRVLPCAAYFDGEFGIKGVFMGVPVKLGSNGVEDVVELKLLEKEKAALQKSAAAVKELIGKLKG